MSNYYDVLNIPPGSSQEDIKKAYKKLAMKYHPDRGGNEDKFKEVTEAYEVLSGKRRPRNQPPPPPNPGFGFDPFDVFSQSPFRRASRARRKPPESDSEVGLGLNLSVEEAADAIVKEMSTQSAKSIKEFMVFFL